MTRQLACFNSSWLQPRIARGRELGQVADAVIEAGKIKPFLRRHSSHTPPLAATPHSRTGAPPTRRGSPAGVARSKVESGVARSGQAAQDGGG